MPVADGADIPKGNASGSSDFLGKLHSPLQFHFSEEVIQLIS